MAAPKIRSRSFRRISVRTPGGKQVIHYERRKPSAAKCGKCGGVLKGVARGIAADVKRVPKSERRPERPYGGSLCSRCMRSVFAMRARTMVMKGG